MQISLLLKMQLHLIPYQTDSHSLVKSNVIGIPKQY